MRDTLPADIAPRLHTTPLATIAAPATARFAGAAASVGSLRAATAVSADLTTCLPQLLILQSAVPARFFSPDRANPPRAAKLRLRAYSRPRMLTTSA